VSLTRDQWSQVKALFAEASEQPSRERLGWLKHKGRKRTQDPAVHAEVLALLETGEQEGPLESVVLVSREAMDETLPAGETLGPWRLLRPIGSGGMGEVYLAERADGAYQQQVALKLLKRGVDTNAVLKRFLRERRILGNLSHPNIARLLDAGAAPDGRPYLVMERVAGQPITEWCRERGLDLRPMLELMIGVCDAVHAAHRQQVVHRDLKPSNVLVGEDGIAKLLDFGIAKLLGEDDGELTQTAFGTALATPRYAAPEQLLGQPVTAASDVFSLGMLLYELLTGTLPPWRQNTLTALVGAKDRRAITRPSVAALDGDRSVDETARKQRARELKGDVDQIVLKAIDYDPRRRYALASELADDLRRYLDGRPVLAQPDSRVYIARKFLRRNWLPVSAAGLIVLALVGGLAVSLWQAGLVRTQARLARDQALRAERVKEFMINVFKSADPDNSQSSTMSAREVLDQGFKQMQSQLDNDPATQADLYDALAQTYLSLGAVDRAQELAQTALAARRKLYPAGDARIAASLLTLGNVLIERMDIASAHAALNEADGIMRASGEADSVLTAQISSALADTDDVLAKRDESVAEQRRGYTICLRILGANAAETARQQMKLAERLEEAGQYADSVQTYRGAIKAIDSSIGPESLTAGTAHLNFASVLDRVDNSAASEQELNRAIGILRKVVGDSHPLVGDALFSRSILLGGEHRYAEGEADLRQSLRIFPAGSYKAAQSQRYLGANLTFQGRYAEAQEQLEASVAGFRKGWPDDMQLYRAISDLATALLRNGQAAQAEPMLRDALKNLERLVGPEAYEVRSPLKRLGEDLIALGRNDEAVAVLNRVRALEIKLFGTEQHRDLASTDYLLGKALLGLGTPQTLAQARPFAEMSVALCRKNFPGHDLGRALLLRARLALAAGDGKSAQGDLAEALDQLGQAVPPDPEDLAEVRKLLRGQRLGKP